MKERARTVWNKAWLLFAVGVNVAVVFVCVRLLVMGIQDSNTIAIIVMAVILVLVIPIAALRIWANAYVLIKGFSDEDEKSQ